MTSDTLWWQHGIIYQIYPRSFQDSNGDGIGDLNGIRQRLDYLQWLGVNAIWISPIFQSPMDDFGYDVADYKAIDSIFGSLADMEALIEAAHQRDIRIILDFVPAHTSDRHAWFQESRASRDNPKRDWYIWRDPKPDGSPPNNWLSHFDGTSAWEWDEQTEQFYLHSFLASQPDLNWRNPELREAMYDNLRFWLDRGVDGFRVDVAHRVLKDEALRDNPPNPDWKPGMDPFKALKEVYTRNLPELHPIFKEMRAVLDEYDERMMVGEVNVPLPDLPSYYGDDDEFHLPFNFQLIHSPWGAETVRQIADHYESLLPAGAWPNWVLGNHDQHRFASRTSPAQARVGLMLLLTLRGTPTIYYGEELGMEDGVIPPDKVQDPWEKNVPGLGLGRDPERTPMQWDDSPNAGFCPAETDPWLPLAENYQSLNVAQHQEDDHSILTMTQQLIALRQQSPALIVGQYSPVNSPKGTFVYRRQHKDEGYLVALNFTDDAALVSLPEDVAQAELTFCTHLDREAETITEKLELRPNEGVLLAI